MENKKVTYIDKDGILSPTTNERCVNTSAGSLYKSLHEHIALPLGILSEGSITSSSKYSTSKFNGMQTSIVMKEPLLSPHAEATLYIKIELVDLKVKVYYGYNEGMSSTTSNVSKYSSQELSDGDSFTFPIDNYSVETGYDKSRYYYRIAFVSSTTELSVDELKHMLELGHIAISYKEPSGGVVSRNPVPTQLIEVSKGYKNMTTKARHRNFVFTHISDLHAHGIALLNTLKYSEAINSQGLFITGDVVAQSSEDGFGYIHEFCKDFAFPSFLTTGNHDGVGLSLSEFNSRFFNDMTATFGYNRGNFGYYYKDLDTPKIRIIALDCSDSNSSYRIGSIGSTQVTWLQNTLSTTPSRYGVIILLHQPLGNLSEDSKTSHPSFAKYPSLASSEVNWTGAASVKTAVDTFIEGGGEFIMYCSGHIHADIVGFIDGTTHKQLQSCIASPNGVYDMQNDVCSVGDGIGSAQDLFNTYIIDRIRHTVRVVRVGANTCEDLSDRLIEEFSYMD